MFMDHQEENNNEEIVYEEDQGAEIVKKLRTRLKTCEQEKKEYLDGWQRLKADMLNTKKQQSTALEVAQQRAIENFVHELLPVLDSFDIALSGDAWERVDKVWRTGIEHVRSQMTKSLEGAGVTKYGEIGDVFDPQLHEAVTHLPAQAGEKGGESGTIARVERPGYRTNALVIRPAQVAVFE